MGLDKKNISILVFILFLGLVLQCSREQESSQILWFDSAWPYRMSVTVDNRGNPHDLKNYQVKIVLTGSNFDFSKARPEGQDIRFTEGDGATLISHWTEYWDSSADSAAVWVKAPHILRSKSSMIYMYFGNSEAQDLSDGEETFAFFDDFNTEYSGATGWTVKAPMPFFYRAADIASAVYNNRIYIFGGYDRDAPSNCDLIIQNRTLAYDPASDSWTQKADMPTGRWGPVAIEFNGLIYVFAGRSLSGDYGIHEVYNPTTDSWSTLSHVPPEIAEQGSMGVKLGDRIHLFYQRYHFEYNPATDTYIRKADPPTPRKWGTCAVVDSNIYLIGGSSLVAKGGVSNANEVYDPVTDSWSSRTPSPICRYGVTQENSVIDGKIYVTHGQNEGFYADNYAYDPAMDSWERKSTGLNPRDGVGCGVVNGKLYVIGGRDITFCVPGTSFVEEYDPEADEGGGSSPWVVSNPTFVRRDILASYKGGYGLLIDKQDADGEQYARHHHYLETYAVDLFWNITDYYKLADVQPQGVIALSASTQRGSLYFYNYNGVPEFRWFAGTFSDLQSGEWNRWYPITFIWNGADSRVIIDGTEHKVQAAPAISDMIYVRASKKTIQYLDRVRVRNYSSPEPTISPGRIEQRKQ